MRLHPGHRTAIASLAIAGVIALGAGPAAAASLDRVVFARGGDLFSVLANGSGLQRLTASNRVESAPVWSATHGRIAFVSAHRSIHLINASGTGEHRIFVLPPRFDAIDAIAWSPTDTALAFASERQRRKNGIIQICSQIWVMSASGADPHTILNGQLFASGLSWSPDGTHLVASFEQPSTTVPCRRDRRPGIFAFAPDGSGVHSLHTPLGTDPDWSPDGRHIVFRDWRRTCHACGEIWEMRPDGAGQHVLATPHDPYHGYFAPAWSPDGRRIAFIAERNNGRTGLWRIDAGGGHLRRIRRHAEDQDW